MSHASLALIAMPLGVRTQGGIALLCKHAQPARNGPGVLEAMLQPREMGTPGSGQPQRCAGRLKERLAGSRVHAVATQGAPLSPRPAGLASSAADGSRAQGEGSTGAAIDAARPLWLRINMSGSLRRAMAYAGVRLRITAAVAHALHAIGGDARWLAPRARAHARRPRPHRAPVNRTALRRWCVDLVPLLLVGWRRSWRRGDGSSRCHSPPWISLVPVVSADARRRACGLERRRRVAKGGSEGTRHPSRAG